MIIERSVTNHIEYVDELGMNVSMNNLNECNHKVLQQILIFNLKN